MTNQLFPKTPDYKLIAALRILAKDANTEEGLLEGTLYEAAARLEELTQPKPIETAPKFELPCVQVDLEALTRA